MKLPLSSLAINTISDEDERRRVARPAVAVEVEVMEERETVRAKRRVGFFENEIGRAHV